MGENVEQFRCLRLFLRSGEIVMDIPESRSVVDGRYLSYVRGVGVSVRAGSSTNVVTHKLEYKKVGSNESCSCDSSLVSCIQCCVQEG